MMPSGLWRGCFAIGVSGRRIGGKSEGLEWDGSDYNREKKGSALSDEWMIHVT